MKASPKHSGPKPKRQGLIRPGGRSERTRHAVTTATLELIKSGNLDFDIQEVARLAGVHRTTIHRRWPDRAALVRIDDDTLVAVDGAGSVLVDPHGRRTLDALQGYQTSRQSYTQFRQYT